MIRKIRGGNLVATEIGSVETRCDLRLAIHSWPKVQFACAECADYNAYKKLSPMLVSLTFSYSRVGFQDVNGSRIHMHYYLRFGELQTGQRYDLSRLSKGCLSS